jgi:hypothetical protein
MINASGEAPERLERSAHRGGLLSMSEVADRVLVPTRDLTRASHARFQDALICRVWCVCVAVEDPPTYGRRSWLQMRPVIVPLTVSCKHRIVWCVGPCVAALNCRQQHWVEGPTVAFVDSSDATLEASHARRIP